MQFGHRQPRELEQRGVVHLFGHVVEIDAETAESAPAAFRGSTDRRRVRIQPHDRFVAALPNLFLDRFAELRVGVVVEFHFRITGQPDQRGARQRHSAVKFVGVAAHDLVKRNEKLLARLEVGRKRHPLLQSARDLDAGVTCARCARDRATGKPAKSTGSR